MTSPDELHDLVSGKQNYFEQAAAALERAMRATGLAEQAQLLDEALRLNRLGLAEERAKLAKIKPNVAETAKG